MSIHSFKKIIMKKIEEPITKETVWKRKTDGANHKYERKFYNNKKSKTAPKAYKNKRKGEVWRKKN